MTAGRPETHHAWSHAVTGAVFAGCGDSEDDAGASPATAATAAATATVAPASTPERDPAARAGRRIRAIDSEFGTVLADRRGEALFLFDKEGGGRGGG